MEIKVGFINCYMNPKKENSISVSFFMEIERVEISALNLVCESFFFLFSVSTLCVK